MSITTALPTLFVQLTKTRSSTIVSAYRNMKVTGTTADLWKFNLQPLSTAENFQNRASLTLAGAQLVMLLTKIKNIANRCKKPVNTPSKPQHQTMVSVQHLSCLLKKIENLFTVHAYPEIECFNSTICFCPKGYVYNQNSSYCIPKTNITLESKGYSGYNSKTTYSCGTYIVNSFLQFLVPF